MVEKEQTVSGCICNALAPYRKLHTFFRLVMSTAIQAIFIRGYEQRHAPKTHIVYRIDIQAHVRSWQMWRRYSEFGDLNTELTKATGSHPPVDLPPKHAFKSLPFVHMGSKELDDRKQGLERYLRAILSAKDDKWRETHAFKEFLGVPVGRQTSDLSKLGQSIPQFTSSTWLDEHADLQSRLRDIWADIHKRDVLSNQGDISGAHKSNVGAKSKLAGVLSRIGTLGKGLHELGMSGLSEGELQRRTDMVARLQDDCEKLSRVVSVARQTSQKPVEGGGFSRSLASNIDREALLGPSAKPVRRVFGAPPEETEVTRPLDNIGLLGLQQQQIEQQDTQLAQLTTILHRQRQLGEAINAEVVSQIELLDDLSNEVDNVGVKLHAAKSQMNKLS